MAGNWQDFTFANPTEDWQKQFNTFQAQSPGMGYNYVNARVGDGQQHMVNGVDVSGAYAHSGMGGMEQLAHGLQAAGFDTGTTDALRNLYGSSGSTAENAARQLGVDPSQWGANAGSYMLNNGQLTGPNGQSVSATGGPAEAGTQYRGSTQATPAFTGNSTWGQYGNPADPNGTTSPNTGSIAPYSASNQRTSTPMSGGTLGSLVNGTAPTTSSSGGILPPSASTGYAYNPSAYLDPSMDFTMQQGLRSLGSSAAAQGQTFSGNNLKDILNYSQGLASTNYNNAAQQAAQQQAFGRGVDTSNTQLGQSQQQINNALNEYNQNFGYQSQLNDQTIPFQQQMQLAQMGLSGAQGSGSLSAALSALLSGNLNTLGQVQGAGTIGANNTLTSAISQILASLGQNNLYNRILPNG